MKSGFFLCRLSCFLALNFCLVQTILAGGVLTPPVVPVIDSSIENNLRSIRNSPAGRTRYADVFMKVGDSITATGSYLEGVGCQNMASPPVASYGAFSSLIPTTQYFARRLFPANYSASWCADTQSNSFNRASYAALSGVTSAYPLMTFEDNSIAGCPAGTVVLSCEIQKINPAFALIMLGTNDVLRDSELDATVAVTQYTGRMTALVNNLTAQGIVPVISTIPPLLDTTYSIQVRNRVPNYNQALIDLAAQLQVPLWNYYRGLNELGGALNYGMDPDGIHPNIYVSMGDPQGDVFTATALNYGYNVRNLTALAVLHELRQKLLSDIFANSFE